MEIIEDKENSSQNGDDEVHLKEFVTKEKQQIKELNKQIEEDKLKYKVNQIHTLTKSLKLLSSYQNLDTWYREKNIKRTSEELAGTATKRVRINMLKIDDPKEPQDQEIELEEQGYKIGLFGNMCA